MQKANLSVSCKSLPKKRKKRKENTRNHLEAPKLVFFWFPPLVFYPKTKFFLFLKFYNRACITIARFWCLMAFVGVRSKVCHAFIKLLTEWLQSPFCPAFPLCGLQWWKLPCITMNIVLTHCHGKKHINSKASYNTSVAPHQRDDYS